jgi:hypothetical protein
VLCFRSPEPGMRLFSSKERGALLVHRKVSYGLAVAHLNSNIKSFDFLQSIENH